jgi:biopolymer transport protein ExbD
MKTFDQINVIPFIDIMLVLLAIVLTTATFVSQGLIKVTLPDADTATSQTIQENKKLEITIDADQQLYCAGQLITVDKLEQQLQSTDKNTNIILRVDKAVRFEKFVHVIDLLKKYQLEKLSILTRARTTR